MYLNKHGALIEFLEYSHGKLRVGSKTSGLRKQKTGNDKCHMSTDDDT